MRQNQISYFIALILFLSPCSAQAQNERKIDSLQNLLSTEIKDTTRVNTLNSLGVVLMYQNPDTSLYYSTEALAIAERNEWKKGIGNCYFYMCIFYQRKGNYPLAHEFNSKALKLKGELGDKQGLASTYGYLGTNYWYQGDFSSALEYYTKALKMNEELGNKKQISAWLGNIGNVHIERGEYTKALNNYFEALKMAKELEDKESIASQLGHIGLVYSFQHDFDKALEYYFESLKLKVEIGQKTRISHQLGNIGVVYREMGNKSKEGPIRQANYSKALEYYSQALKMDEELDNKNGVATHLGNIGNCYIGKGNAASKASVQEEFYATAFDYFFKSLALRKELGDKNRIVSQLGNIGGLYLEIKKHEEAERYLLEALELGSEIGASFYNQIWNQALSALYEETGEDLKALEHYKAYTIIKDSLFNEQKSKDLGKLEAKHEFETAEMERKRAEEELAKLEAANKTRRDNLQYSGILIFLVVLGIGLIVLGKLNIPARLAEGMIFFSFLLFFEFTLVMLDPYIDQYSSGAPAIKLAFNAVLAALIFPIHSFFESKMKGRLVKK